MANDRPESLISILKAIAEVTLLVCGIIGIAVELFHEQGLLKHLISRLMNAAFSSSIIGILAVLLLIVLGKVSYDRIVAKASNANALGNFLMRAMMTAGAYFLYLVITTGSFKI